MLAEILNFQGANPILGMGSLSYLFTLDIGRVFLLCAFIYVTLSTSQRRDSELSSNLKTATADSGWKYMTNANNLSEKLKFRKIGHMVFVAGSIRFSDNGKFANDQALGSVPSGMTPNGYDEFECLIPIAMHNGGPAGTQARIYIKNGGVYIVGTDSASFVMIATTAYFS